MIQEKNMGIEKYLLSAGVLIGIGAWPGASAAAGPYAGCDKATRSCDAALACITQSALKDNLNVRNVLTQYLNNDARTKCKNLNAQQKQNKIDQYASKKATITQKPSTIRDDTTKEEETPATEEPKFPKCEKFAELDSKYVWDSSDSWTMKFESFNMTDINGNATKFSLPAYWITTGGDLFRGSKVKPVFNKDDADRKKPETGSIAIANRAEVLKEHTEKSAIMTFEKYVTAKSHQAVKIATAYAREIYGWETAVCFAFECNEAIGSDDNIMCVKDGTLASSSYRDEKTKEVRYRFTDPDQKIITFQFDDICRNEKEYAKTIEKMDMEYMKYCIPTDSAYTENDVFNYLYKKYGL
ncbi:MAG: hypothetical protein LBK26_02705 [Rickettsiales bacterium]|jgi:hypothetical protein|nr:hypothetical protein [Rickettsiales bacterium]